MRKMTKTAVTLAAMSAMTAAAASMVFAAEKQEPNISSVAKQVETVNSSAVGEWSGSDVDGWKFTKEDGTKLKDQWAEIDGVWYYFIGEKMAQDRFLTLDNKGYFFDHTGRLATGWQRITSDMDAYSDIDIAEALYDPYNNYYVHVNDNAEYGYHDYVWCYFDNNGVAKHNEWFQDGSGLWYYFDGDVMVKNVYNYEVIPDNYDAADSRADRIYGFDEEGAMLVGWNYKETDGKWNDPTADDKGRIWYYYNSNGRMQQAGWKSIDGKWYLFANYDADNAAGYGVGSRDDDRWSIGGYPLITNSYVASYNRDKYEYFYVDKDGKMVTGVKEVPKDAYRVLFYTEANRKDQTGPQVAYEVVKTGDAVTVNFGSNGAAKDGIVDNRYYAMETKNTTKASFDSKNAGYAYKVNNSLYNAAYSFNTEGTGKIMFTAKKDEWDFTVTGNGLAKDTAVLDKADPVSLTNPNQVDDFEAIIATIKKQLNPGTAAQDDSATTYFMEEKNKSLAENVKYYVGQAKTASSSYTSASTAYDNAVYERDYTTKVTLSYAVSGYSLIEATTDWVKCEPSQSTRATNPVLYLDTVTKALNDAKKEKETQIRQAGLLSNNEDKVTELTNELKAINDTLNKVTGTDGIAQIVNEEVDNVCGNNITTLKKALDQAETALKTSLNNLEAVVKDAARAGLYVATGNDKYELQNYNDISAITIWAEQVTNDFTVVGELVKAAFIGQNDYVYFADDKGDLVTNKAVLINTTAGIPYGDTTYNNAYILFGSDGKGIYGYDGTRKSISVGGVTYWATDNTVKVGKAKELTVFVANKQIDGQY